jgi:RNA polymerase sigma factor (sigma-70 family)
VLGNGSGFRPRQTQKYDIEELTQDVMTLLFADSGRILLAWDGERGLSFRNYVGLVAERSTRRIVRSRNHRMCSSPSECASSPREEEIEDSGPGPESLLAAREYVEVVVSRVRNLLSPQARKLFDLLLLEGRPIDEVCHLTGLTREATYTWRSRLARMARRIAREVENEKPDAMARQAVLD